MQKKGDSGMTAPDNQEVEQWLQELAALDDKRKITSKQLKIIQSAVEIFAEKGYSAASTSEIAQRAGVAEGTIFRHYKTKKDLLLSIVSPLMSRLVAPFVINNFKEVLVPKYDTFEDFLRTLLVNRIAFVRKHMKVIKILIQEIPFQADLRSAFLEQVGKPVFERILAVIVHYQQKGQLIGVKPELAMRFMFSTLMALIAEKFILFPDKPWNEPEEIEQTIRLCMRGIGAAKEDPGN